VQLTKKPDVAEQQPAISPDGKWLAYTSDESKRQNEVYVRSMSADDLKYQVSTGGGVRPRWRADGKELFFLGEDGKLMAVPVKSGAAFEYGTPVVLFKPPVPETPGTSGYVVSPDGQRFLFRTIPTGANSGSITVVSNWFAAVRQ
jgi:hypothetical protein